MIGLPELEEVQKMGTTKSGRYFGTQGSRNIVGDRARVHSNEGTFKWRDKKGKKEIRLASGGHGETGRKMLDKYGIEYHIVKTYPNGVRVGHIPDHVDKRKRSGLSQTWFPKEWTGKDIKRAGEHVVGIKKNRNSKDGVAVFGMYKGVRVGVIKTNGTIATVFPDSKQPSKGKRRK